MTLTHEQAANLFMSIVQNEGTVELEVSDSQIAFYLEMFDYEASEENIRLVRAG